MYEWLALISRVEAGGHILSPKKRTQRVKIGVHFTKPCKSKQGVKIPVSFNMKKSNDTEIFLHKS